MNNNKCPFLFGHSLNFLQHFLLCSHTKLASRDLVNMDKCAQKNAVVLTLVEQSELAIENAGSL